MFKIENLSDLRSKVGIIEENVKLRTREDLAKSVEEWKAKNQWPFDTTLKQDAQ